MSDALRGPGKIRILLADDHEDVRACVRSLLTREPDFEVIAEASNGRMAVEMNQRQHPDVVVMDVNMPNLTGIEATRQIKRDAPLVTVIGLSMHDSEQVRRALRAAGSAACLTKDGSVDLLVDTIRRSRARAA